MSDQAPLSSPSEQVGQFASLLSSQLSALRERMYPPHAQKSLRKFSAPEAARLLSIAESTIRQMSLDGEGPDPERLSNGRRIYSLQEINALREYLAHKRPNEHLKFLPNRQQGEGLQVLSVANFKGGSAKTTTSVHLSHFLALQGYRVLAIDLDPQASMSAMFGAQPELDVGPNETLWAAIRYDEEQRPLRDVIRKTYFDGLDLVPGNLELMEFEHATPQAIVSGQSKGDGVFFRRISACLEQVSEEYDIVIFDTPPQLGYLTLGALFASTGLMITVHPSMLDVASMNQFLLMMSDIMNVIEEAGGSMDMNFMRFLITRHNPNDAPQQQVVGLLRMLLGDAVLTNSVFETTAVANAGLDKRSLYEIETNSMGRDTYRRAMESMDSVNHEILSLIQASWGRS
ncbi:plasmid partitioning protein RepA [uncultured Cohaesibacter sp.]|uniref:plasmid partitioning protein RepA n=1 Tax=uncultured Cohaesibacter sp. TaxID=1002546 RepID=UPI002A0A7EC6|nr:plasmid partitioning protein RepA [uncultured Cohaesibacter sp.]